MSKKGSHGDGQHGKGTKGMKKPFEEVFVSPKAPAKADQQQDERNAAEQTDHNNE